ncbi:uncharacterized protein F5891DRAFT_1181075 [Suillus fuscotomentosus]|uniref:Uncharacterized protein n=1 Tax=Suillus fuscotomentosus TaxID=1912939 RepID=A0AAD4HTG4_9AGAM|nr:uncharacterized protein F5891DRAFT_1181075 [Suillus fuscotomentosus]KAG1908052.1 hypothetical protein F5891DRAFT_1181075 [Suillus fuscotomentosus]
MYADQELERRYHMHLAARLSPSLPSVALTSAASTSSAQTSAAQNSDTPSPTSAPTITTPTTPTTTPVATSTQQTSLSTTPTTSSSSTTSSLTVSSGTPSSSTSTLSTSSPLAPQIALSTTPPAAATLYTTSQLASPTHIVISTGTIASATPSSTAGSSGSINTTAVVGGIAGCLVGLAILGFLIMWCIRRKRQSDEDEWSASAFKRQSAILVDDPEPSFNPRPPTMIERHNASPAINAQHNYQNYYGGYGQQATYSDTLHPQMAMPHAPHGDHSHLTRQPSSAAYLSRQPSDAGYPIPNDPQAHYVNLDRSSVTPFQAAQYADISRQLGSDLHMVPPQPSESSLPSPFDDEAAEETYPTHDAALRAPSPVHVGDPFAAASTASTPEPVPASRRRDISNAQRPDTVYTVYEEGDAYDGI